MKPSLQVLALTKYGRLGASSRMRCLQYLPGLELAGVHVTVQSLLPDDELQARYLRGRYDLRTLLGLYAARVKAMLQRHRFDLVWIEKEALPWLPAGLERWLLHGVPYVLDYDDAIFHNYDLHRSRLVRWGLGRRLDKLMAGAQLVVCGNSYLAQRAHDADAPWVELLPTVVDLRRYALKPAQAPVESVPCIVWIGSPSTTRYLALLGEPLRLLGTQLHFKLRVIGSDILSMPGVDIECVSWSEATEAQAIQAGDIGVMPLLDSPWESGKCGYKLIQYMACGLPVVASMVGANAEIVTEGRDGYLARTIEDWPRVLNTLLRDAALRTRMGQAGRQKVEQHYCLRQAAPRLAVLLHTAAGKD